MPKRKYSDDDSSHRKGSEVTTLKMEGTVPMDVDEDPMLNAEESAEDGCSVSNRPFAENEQHCTIKLGKEASPESVLEPICAILNSGGGVVKMKIAGFSTFTSELFNKQFDIFWSKLEEKLSPMVQPSAYADVFDRKIMDDEIHLFITAPNHHCTVDYNLFLPADAKVLPPTYLKVQELLSKKPLEKEKKISDKPQVPVEDLPAKTLLPKTFKFKEVLNFHESKQIQLKYYPGSNKLLHNNNRTQNEKIRKQISAFGNGNGGMILLGVDDTGKVHGQNLERDSEAELEERVELIVNEMCEISRIKPTRSVHWDIKFFPVEGMESNPVIVIYIAGMQNLGGIFTKCPKSFELQRPSGSDGEEKIVRLDFHEWKKQMLRGTHLDESKGIEAETSKCSLTDLLEGPLLTVDNSVEEIKDAFFPVERGCPVSPKGFEKNLTETAKQVIERIQKQCPNRSLLVASPSWSSCITKGENYRKEGIICDLLLFDQEKGGLHLLTLCNSESKVHLAEQYALNTAKALKNDLVVKGGCHEKFYITYHVVPCYATLATTLNVADLLCHDSRYPDQFKLKSSQEKVDKILNALVVILAKVPSMLSNKQGISFFNLLTEPQFKILYHNFEKCRELWINGAAGTGKTLVAVAFIRKLRLSYSSLGKNNILYVCESIGLKTKISKLDICQCVCIGDFMRQEFPDVKHVVMDGVQNYQSKDGQWFERARKMVRQHFQSSHDSNSDLDSDSDGPGFLWLFIDKNQKMHLASTGVPRFQEPNCTLKKVIRNSGAIFDWAIEYAQTKTKPTLGHDFSGEPVRSEIYRKGEQINELNEQLRVVLDEGYSEGDIVVLFVEAPNLEDLSSQLSSVGECVGAVHNDSEAVVVSSLRDYSGLQRPVVILADVHTDDKKLYRRFYYCACTRAMVKLVEIHDASRGYRIL